MWAGVLGGRGVIYLPSSGERDGLVGGAGSFIVKEATSLPHIVGLQTPEPDEEVSVFAPLTGPSDDDDNEAGFLLADAAGRSRIFTFPHHRDVDMGNGWCVQKISVPGREGIAEEVRQVAFHEGRGVYVVATCAPEPFFWADEDSRHEKQDGELASFHFPCSISMFLWGCIRLSFQSEDMVWSRLLLCGNTGPCLTVSGCILLY